MKQTIVALSSGAPPSAIGVIRLSGPAALEAAKSLSGTLPPDREARVRSLRDRGQLLDHAIVIVFPGPENVTGEDLVEFHVHGGGAVVRSVISALLSHSDVREALPGEFTRRALQNGRLDLTQVEALADLLAAQTASQHRAAVLASDGSLRRAIDELQVELLGVSALIELTLDFADESDAADDDASVLKVRAALTALGTQTLDWASRPTVDQLHTGFQVVLAGPPNAGKSTLLNALAARDVAIVSDIAGTTRDRIEVAVSHNGVAFTLIDTAGLNDTTTDEIELIGIDRAKTAVENADVVIWLGEGTAPTNDSISIFARADVRSSHDAADRLMVSANTGLGLNELWSAIHQRIANRLPPEDGTALNDRQQTLMKKIGGTLIQASAESDAILIAHHVSNARSTLTELGGSGDTEAMLDALFGRFCIGK